MGRDSIKRLAALQVKLTTVGGEVIPGTDKVFTELHRYFGLQGIEALDSAGYNEPVKVWDFYLECRENVFEMARRLDLFD